MIADSPPGGTLLPAQARQKHEGADVADGADVARADGDDVARQELVARMWLTTSAAAGWVAVSSLRVAGRTNFRILTATHRVVTTCAARGAAISWSMGIR